MAWCVAYSRAQLAVRSGAVLRGAQLSSSPLGPSPLTLVTYREVMKQTTTAESSMPAVIFELMSPCICSSSNQQFSPAAVSWAWIAATRAWLSRPLSSVPQSA